MKDPEALPRRRPLYSTATPFSHVGRRHIPLVRRRGVSCFRVRCISEILNFHVMLMTLSSGTLTNFAFFFCSYRLLLIL